MQLFKSRSLVKYPSGQSLHSSLSLTSLYFPTLHPEHCVGWEEGVAVKRRIDNRKFLLTHLNIKKKTMKTYLEYTKQQTYCGRASINCSWTSISTVTLSTYCRWKGFLLALCATCNFMRSADCVVVSPSWTFCTSSTCVGILSKSTRRASFC